MRRRILTTTLLAPAHCHRSEYERGRLTLAELGRFAEAAAYAADATRLVEPTHHAFSLGWAHSTAGLLHLFMGDWVCCGRRQIRFAVRPYPGTVRGLIASPDYVKAAGTPASPDCFDAQLQSRWTYVAKKGRSVMVYIPSGAVTVAAGTSKNALHEGEAVGIRIEKSDESLVLTPEGHVHLLLLSGEDPKEPVVAYGPFIMNTQEEIAEAFDRYRAGKMGRLEAVHVSA